MGVTVKEMESKKRILEEAVDGLNEEIAKLKATCEFNKMNYMVISPAGLEAKSLRWLPLTRNTNIVIVLAKNQLAQHLNTMSHKKQNVPVSNIN